MELQWKSFGSQDEFSMKYQKKLILNPIGIQWKFQRNINGNPFNPVKNKISMKYP